MNRLLALLPLLLLAAPAAHAQTAKPPVDFAKQIKPIFQKHCYECHSAKKDKGGFAFDSLDRLASNIGRGRIIVPGNLPDSDLIDVLQGTNGKKKMPPKDKGSLSAKEIEDMRDWIKEGAIVPGLKPDPAVAARSSSTSKEPQMQEWTNTEGKTLRAAFVDRVNDGKTHVVHLRLADGKVIEYPMSKLDTKSQSQAKLLELRQ